MTGLRLVSVLYVESSQSVVEAMRKIVHCGEGKNPRVVWDMQRDWQQMLSGTFDPKEKMGPDNSLEMSASEKLTVYYLLDSLTKDYNGIL